jgi:hypothetical protein
MQNDKISICPLWQWSSYIRYQHKLILYGLLAIHKQRGEGAVKPYFEINIGFMYVFLQKLAQRTMTLFL